MHRNVPLIFRAAITFLLRRIAIPRHLARPYLFRRWTNMLSAKLVSGATITAAPTADKSHLVLEMSGADFQEIRVLLSLTEAKNLFCLVDLAVADLESANAARK